MHEGRIVELQMDRSGYLVACLLLEPKRMQQTVSRFLVEACPYWDQTQALGHLH